MSPSCRSFLSKLRILRLVSPRLGCSRFLSTRRTEWTLRTLPYEPKWKTLPGPSYPSEIFALAPWHNTPAFEPIAPIPGPKSLEAWVEALEPYFNDYMSYAAADEVHDAEDPNFRQTANGRHQMFLSTQIADLVMRARFLGGHSLILHLALKKRWSMVSWIIRAISDRLYHMGDTLVMAYEPFHVHHAKNSQTLSLDILTDDPLDLRMDRQNDPYNQPRLPLPKEENEREHHLTVMDAESSIYSDGRSFQFRTQRGALGEVLSSLGQLILHAYHLDDVKESQDTMSHVLDTLAILHQNGVMPEFTYQCMPSLMHSNQAPPPYLEALSMPIMSAMLDAQWNLFQNTPDLATFSSDAQSQIAGFEFSDHNNPGRILPYAHEVWLELILWTCLRAGWVYSGMELLKKIASLNDSLKWRTFSWRESVSSSPHGSTVIQSRALSSELVYAYAEALVDAVETGVGGRGIPLDHVVASLKILKTFLDESESSTASFSWATILTHLLDTCGSISGPIKLSKDMLDLTLDESLQRPVSLVDNPRGLLLSDTVNSLQEELVQTADLTTKLLAAYIDQGQIYLVKELLTGLKNKGLVWSTTKSLEVQQDDTSRGSSSRSIAIAPEVLARLVHFLTDIRDQEPEQAEFFDDIVAPLLPPEFDSHSVIGPALVRYAVATSNADLLRATLKNAISHSREAVLKENVMLALLLAQVEGGRWEAVRGTTKLAVHASSWQIRIVVVLVREILRMQGAGFASEKEANDLAIALDILRACIIRNINWYGDTNSRVTNTMFTILGILARVHPEWKAFIGEILERDKQIMRKVYLERPTELHPNFFATILCGIADLGGAALVQQIWVRWCSRIETPNRGRLDMMPRRRPRQTLGWRPKEPITVIVSPRTTLYFLPRFKPNLTMVRVLVRYCDKGDPVVQQEVWQLLTQMGLEGWQIKQELEGNSAKVLSDKGRWKAFDDVAVGMDEMEGGAEIVPELR